MKNHPNSLQLEVPSHHTLNIWLYLSMVRGTYYLTLFQYHVNVCD